MKEIIFGGEESSLSSTEIQSSGSNKENNEETIALTSEQISERLKIIGKTWNFSNYTPPSDFEKLSGKRTPETEGYTEEHQYLHLEATNLALTNISILPNHCFWLISIDLSGNKLKNTSSCPLSKLRNLVSLKLNNNLFKDPYMPPMKHLQCLEMKENEICSLHRIYHPNLMVLDLSYNCIKDVDSADSWKLKKLEKLILRKNNIATISGIEYLSLSKLYLAENEIENLTGIEMLINLKYLHLRDNPLSDLTGFTQNNENLIYLNIRKCLISEVGELEKIQCLKGLKTLIIQENSFNDQCQEEEENAYRIEILSLLPSLTRIDKKLISPDEYYEAVKIAYDNRKNST